ncbi:hypothetical protein ABQ039_019165 [Xanthomonas sp. WHRI 6108]|uniref:hypothetical protein n=1 Tax=Xanthomonas sp. WHRI 6108 TaxID=3161567 RepID=UPI0032E9125A
MAAWHRTPPNGFASTCGIASRANRDAMEIAAPLPIAALLHDVWKDSTTQALAHARAASYDISISHCLQHTPHQQLSRRFRYLLHRHADRWSL